MMDKKRFIQEYKKLKQEAAPDLWGRIEGGLRSHPERPTGGEGMGMEKKPGKPVFWQGKPVYQLAAAAAAMLALAIVAPQITGQNKNTASGEAPAMEAQVMAEGGDAGGAAETTAAGTWAIAAAEDGMAEAAAEDGMAEAAAPKEAAGGAMLQEAEGAAPQPAQRIAPQAVPEREAKAAEDMKNGGRDGANGSGGFRREEYGYLSENGFQKVAKEPVSTFSVDVDTASYGNIRRMVRSGVPVPEDAVRIEEMINYFPYDYPDPKGKEPFSVTTEYSDCPWKEGHRLLLIGLKARDIDFERRPASNFVFLLDVSGSMYSDDKLPLVQKSFAMLAQNLTENDCVSIVTYAGEEQVVLDGAPGDQAARIAAAIEDLEAGGPTAGAAGIQKAYELAEKHFIPGGNNRVILATDGDMNVGASSEGELVRLVQEKKKGGVHLSVLGVGTGNLQDSKMEALADNGDGNYHYLDSLMEAKKVLVEEMCGTLVTVAKDVKIQVEFNPEYASAYRLIGYEDRLLANGDFDNDQVDAGEIGAGHRITALYEVIPADKGAQEGRELKYQAPGSFVGSSELLTVSLRYKKPDGNASMRMEHPVEALSYRKEQSENMAFASAVAEFGMVLKDSKYKGSSTYKSVAELAEACVRPDSDSYRKEFLELVQEAERMYR